MIDLAIGYIRVSTKDQERQSPESQLKEIQKYIKERGWQWRKPRLRDLEMELDERVNGYKIKRDDPKKPEIPVSGIFVESDSVSDWEKGRVEYEKMMAYIKKHKINHLLYGYTDRLYRNIPEWGDFIREFKKINPDIHFHIITEGLTFCPFYDEDYYDNELHDQQVLRAKSFSKLLSIRVKKAHKDRSDIGRHTHLLSYGYVSKADPDTRALHVKIVPEEAEIIKMIFEKIATGEHTRKSITDWLYEKGYKKRTYERKTVLYSEKPFARWYIDFMLQNQAYLGKVKYHGEYKDGRGNIPQIIDQEIFDRIQKKTKSRSQKTTSTTGKYRSPFAPLCKCHFCNSQITTDQKMPRKKTYNLLVCTNGKKFRNPLWYKDRFDKRYETNLRCPLPSYNEKFLEEAIDFEVGKTCFDDYILMWLEDELRKEKASSKKSGAGAEKSLQERRAKLEKRKDNINTMRADGELDKHEFLDMKREIVNELETVEKRLTEIKSSTVNVEEELEITIDYLEILRDKWSYFSLNEKAEILEIMAKKIVLGNDAEAHKDRKSVSIEWEKPWSYMIAAGSSIESAWYALVDMFRTNSVKQKAEKIFGLLRPMPVPV